MISPAKRGVDFYNDDDDDVYLRLKLEGKR
jgi:hypothetical protein